MRSGFQLATFNREWQIRYLIRKRTWSRRSGLIIFLFRFLLSRHRYSIFRSLLYFHLPFSLTSVQGRAAAQLVDIFFFSSFDHAESHCSDGHISLVLGFCTHCISNNLLAYRQILFLFFFLLIIYDFPCASSDSILYHVVTSRSPKKCLVPPPTIDWPPGVAISGPIAASLAVKPTPSLRAFSSDVSSVEPKPRHHYWPNHNRQWIVLCPSRRLIRRKRREVFTMGTSILATSTGLRRLLVNYHRRYFDDKAQVSSEGQGYWWWWRWDDGEPGHVFEGWSIWSSRYIDQSNGQ